MNQQAKSRGGSKKSASSSARREYDGSGRQRDAERRRQRILDAAAMLFVEQGFGDTSIDQIAQAAEVAAPTVYAAFGSKPALLKRLIDVAVAGDDEEVPMADRDEFSTIGDGEDATTALRRLAELAALVNGRAGSLIRVLSSVAGTDDSLAELEIDFRRQVRVHAASVIDIVVDELRDDVPPDELTDRLAFYLAPTTWCSLVIDAGWSTQQYIDWLHEVAVRTLLRPEVQS